MTEWEVFYFRKFFLNGSLVCISKTVKISAFSWNNLFRYFLMISHMPKFYPCICNLKVTLMSKKGGFSPPVHLVFHFFQPNLEYILRFTKDYPDFMVTLNC